MEPYNGRFDGGTISGRTIRVGSSQFTFPSRCAPKCVASSPFGGVIAAAQCGESVATTVIDRNGKSKYLVETEGAILGTCWCARDSVSVSYYKTKRGAAFVNSFSLANNSQRAFATQALVVAASGGVLVLASGEVISVPEEKIHGAVPMQPSYAHAYYEPELSGERKGGAFEGAKAVANENGIVAIQNKDIHVLDDAMSFPVSTHLIVVGVFVVLSLGLYLNSFFSKKSSFWK